MALPELRHSAQRLVEEARREGRDVTFHVTRVKERRWNWILTMRDVSTDLATGEATLSKVFLQTSKDRESLQLIREHLESQLNAQ